LHRRHVAGLLDVTGIALIDRDAEEHARPARLVRPHGLDVGHAGLLDLLA
jgi:hypothetical protein